MKQTRIFIVTTLEKQSLKQIQSPSIIDSCGASQTKLSHKTTDAALKIPQNLTINSTLFADKPNSPGEGCGESPCPQARQGTKELFLLPGDDDTESDSPQKNVPHVGVPILQSNIAPASPPRTMGMAPGDTHGSLRANPTPPTSAK